MKSVCFNSLPGTPVDLYDVLGHDYVSLGVSSEACFDIAGTSAKVIVVLPAGSKITRKGNQYQVGDKIVAYPVKESTSYASTNPL